MRSWASQLLPTLSCTGSAATSSASCTRRSWSVSSPPPTPPACSPGSRFSSHSASPSSWKWTMRSCYISGGTSARSMCGMSGLSRLPPRLPSTIPMVVVMRLASSLKRQWGEDLHQPGPLGCVLLLLWSFQRLHFVLCCLLEQLRSNRQFITSIFPPPPPLPYVTSWWSAVATLLRSVTLLLKCESVTYKFAPWCKWKLNLISHRKGEMSLISSNFFQK